MTAQEYIEKYIELIDDENWDVFWDGVWYHLDSKEVENCLTILDQVGISKRSSHEIRESLYRYWLESLLKACPDNKEISILLYVDMRTDFGLSDDECYDIFIEEMENHKDSLYLDRDDMFIRRWHR